MSASALIITLTIQQILHAASIGLKRHLFAQHQHLRQHANAAFETPAERLYNDIVGALGEMAAGIALCAYWMATVGKAKEVDLLPDWQVRTTCKHSNCLIVRNGDKDIDRFVLVTMEKWGELHVRGWLYGSEAKKPEWRVKDKHGALAWFVPAEALRPIGFKDPPVVVEDDIDAL